jgi:murein L,D-transpeptidase YcbB/YkuD
LKRTLPALGTNRVLDMGRGRFRAVTALGALALALPAHAQQQDVAPVPAETAPAAIVAPTAEPTASAAPEAGTTPASAPVAPTPPVAAAPASAPVVLSDSSVDSFYTARAGAPVWFRDAETREAATKLAALLRNGELDGLADSAELAAAVDAAIARALPDDDKTISVAWVRYVRALKAPVLGISYGDPALAIQNPSADSILASAAGAASLSAHVAQVAAVNSFYSALREAAVKQGAASDPHVRATLDRLRLLPASGRAILVDVANAELMTLEDGRVVDSMKVIVGKQVAPTPLLAGTIHYVTFNPYWHIPQDVARRKVAPIILKRGVSYLKSARYETVASFGGDKELPIDPLSVDWKAVADGTIEVHVRQRTGPNNMMGAMKFGFVNNYGVFLHDTPHKDLFAKAKRNLSLGCVRVEHPERLAQWLLGRDPVPPSDGAEQLVQVDKGVPIYILYLTARPNGDQLAFADDVYGLDKPAEPLVPVATASASAKH